MIESFKLPNITPETLTGSIVSFNDEYGNLPLKSCTSLISGYQEGSGTPSPSNVRPLHAFSSADLYFNTINQWDEVAEVGTIDTTTGKNVSNNSRLRSTNYVLVIPDTTYYIKMPTANNEYILWYEYDSNKNFIRYLYKSNGTTVTTTSNTRFVRFSTVDYGTTYNNDISINYPATDTSYHAFSGAVFTFGQSIYQGYIDWKRGVVVATIGVRVFDGSSDETWRTYSGQRYTVPVSDFTSPSNSQLANIMCDKLETITKAQQGSRTFVISGSDADSHDFMVNVGANSYNDMIDWLNANPITVAYELATPIEIPLGGVNLITQQGQNNIYCDTGNTTLEYIKAGR